MAAFNMHAFPLFAETTGDSWPDAVDLAALAVFVLLALGLPALGYVFMALDIRRYLRSLRRALVIVASAVRRPPNWSLNDSPPCLQTLGLTLPCTEEEVLAAYRQRVKDVITPKFAVSFDKQAGTAEEIVAKADISRSADVFATGVSAIDSDSATALVAGTFTDSYPKQGQLEPTPFRFEVTLVKVKGSWLVDNFTPVTGVDQ